MNLRNLYLRLAGRMPLQWRRRLESIPLHYFWQQHYRQCRQAWLSGPPYRPSHKRIIIDITTACNLGCVDCNRSCAPEQAPSGTHMRIEQIEKFIDESVAGRRRWSAILIEGGEPTLHPQFERIVQLLDGYRRRHSPTTWIQINTNGYPEEHPMLLRLPAGMDVYSSAKQGRVQGMHCAFNVAPADLPEFAGADFSGGCFQPAQFGLGLTIHGYYPHPCCGGIDRVFGFDVGRKNLPSPDDDLGDQFEKLCRYCGCFRIFNRLAQPVFSIAPPEAESERKGQMTASWREVYRRYREAPPKLSLY